MAETYWLCIAALAALVGMGWLALSLGAHWRQVMTAIPAEPATPPSASLRLMGAGSLAIALVFCLFADHGSMAVLVWFMFLAASAVSIAMMLTWQCQWLRLLALPWSIGRRPEKR